MFQVLKWKIEKKIHEDNTRKGGVQSLCITSTKQYHNNRKEQRNAYQRLKKTDFNFKLICDITTRSNKAFKSQNIRKTMKTFDFIGCSLFFFESWIFHQIYVDMTIEKIGPLWQLDHSYPLWKINFSNENVM